MQAGMQAILNHPSTELSWCLLSRVLRRDHSQQPGPATAGPGAVDLRSGGPRPATDRSKICVRLTSICEIERFQSLPEARSSGRNGGGIRPGSLARRPHQYLTVKMARPRGTDNLEELRQLRFGQILRGRLSRARLLKRIVEYRHTPSNFTFECDGLS